MVLNPQKPRIALNKAYLKIKPLRTEIELFKTNLITLIDDINEKESEEFHKNLVTDFLKNTYYLGQYFINTKDRNDFVIHNGANAVSNVGVIVETKKPSNKAEMIRTDRINVKAFQELVLYYLRERITHKNSELKYLIATNIYEWFIFDAHLFEKLFAQNKSLIKQFTDFEEKRASGESTDYFYKQIAAPVIEAITQEVSFTYFDIRTYEKPLRNNNPKDDNLLIALYKLLSPQHLLKLPFANDSNSLDKVFYTELLHIIGLTEIKEGSKKLIQRKKEGERNNGSLLENTITQLESHDKLSRLSKLSQYGNNHQEQLFGVALELVITWINRVLFLKLLEAQLLSYHKGDKNYTFLNGDKIRDYDDLDKLFFRILARKPADRDEKIQQLFGQVPYLNSSLFEPTDLEHQTIFINGLEDFAVLPVLPASVLRDATGKKMSGSMDALQYLFAFMDAYNFSSEGSEEIQEDNKRLINASVLGLIFEKINGYKDGSFFTPGFITMYMCRETIRRAVVQKFNDARGWECKEFDELYDRIEDRTEANTIINTLKICDPAVGSGHFLVSALNEIIAIKSELRILQDREGKRLKEYSVQVENDELVVTDDDGLLFEYNPNSKESQRMQETLFHEKQTIIENCLFGVDINPNSVKICRLRLWIELLKNAYYRTTDNVVETWHAASPKATRELETLPNIDINIKCGNSLISRYNLDSDLKKTLKGSKWTIGNYRDAVKTYRNTKSKEVKREMEKLILNIKQDFTAEIRRNDPLKTRLDKLSHELYNRFTGNFIFEPHHEYGKNDKLEKKKKAEQKKLEDEINTISQKMNEIRDNKIFENSFEWRFEFPEVLNDEGDFVGFDVVIGNPPYIRQEEFAEIKQYLNSKYEIYHSLADLLTYFVELSHHILKSNGIFQFIISGKFTRAGYGILMRKFLSEKTEMTHLIDFGGKSIFDEATVDATIIGFIKKTPFMNSKIVYREVQKDDIVSINFNQYIKENALSYPTKSLSEDVWSFDNPKWLPIINKINKNGVPLSDWDVQINFGIKTGYNEAFVIDEIQRNKLLENDPKSIEILLPLLRGRDIQKYVSGPIMNWVIGSFPSKKIDIDQYISVREYLLTFGNTIHQTGEKGSRKRTSHKWYETQDNIAFWQDFEKPKLVWKRIGSILRFCYDESGAYCLDSTCIATGSKVKFLTAVLNSKLAISELFRLSPKTGTGDLIISVQALHPLRIPMPNETQEKNICDTLDEIIDLKRKDLSADTTTLESQIDQLVYELYGLTEEEIRIVEGK